MAGFGKDFGDQITGLIRLAYVGAAAVAVLILLVPAGLIAMAWWAWNHLSVSVR